MSKRKNTLNDLEEFLKLQASTLVAPQPVETFKPTEVPKQTELVKEELPIVQTTHAPAKPIETTRAIDLLDEMKKLASQNRNGFYDHIIKVAEGSDDVLLINTALYLKHGDNWRAGIESYWRTRKKLVVNH